jgi:hypothetical protein
MITETLKAEDKPVVQMTGGVATRNAFHVFDSATNEQIIAAIGKVREMEGATAWWLGDLGLAIQQRKLDELASKAKELRARAESLDGSDPEQAAVKNNLLEQAEDMENGAEIKYRDSICEAFGIDRGYWANCVSLARFYPPSLRNEGLTVEHHIAAMRGAKRDGEKIQEVLKRAKINGQSAAELRKQLAEESASHRPPTSPPFPLDFSELGRADTWAKRFRGNVKGLTPDQAMAILLQGQALKSLFDELESIAKGMS